MWDDFKKIARSLKIFKLDIFFPYGTILGPDFGEIKGDQRRELDKFYEWKHKQEQHRGDRINELSESAPKLEVLDLSFDYDFLDGDDRGEQLGWMSSCLKTHAPANLRELRMR